LTQNADPASGRWERLRKDVQFGIACKVAQRRAKSLRKRFPNVIGVGAGLRSTRGKLRKTAPICLLFTVAPGQKQGWRDDRGRSIPARIAATVKLRGRTVKVNIPTDVLDLAVGYH
jgi:hypothetical protein